jgi:hypothetical protein
MSGCAIAEAVSQRFLFQEVRVRAPVSPRGIYLEQNGSQTDFSQNSSVFPCQCYSITAAYSVVLSGG